MSHPNLFFSITLCKYPCIFCTIGGYLEDKFTKGCYDLDQEPYTFIHWSKIDTFIYFSHHFITIPPIGWIEAGHKNGVSILGTIITEFDAGAKIWKTIFSSSENTKLLIQKCVKICQHVGFDGWLLNVENVIDKENQGILAVIKYISAVFERNNIDRTFRLTYLNIFSMI